MCYYTFYRLEKLRFNFSKKLHDLLKIKAKESGRVRFKTHVWNLLKERYSNIFFTINEKIIIPYTIHIY